MAARKVQRDPLTSKLRHFAWSIALLLAVLSWVIPHAQPLGPAAAFIFALGTVLPHSFNWPYFALDRTLRAVLPAKLIANAPSNPPHRSSRRIRKTQKMKDREASSVERRA